MSACRGLSSGIRGIVAEGAVMQVDGVQAVSMLKYVVAGGLVKAILAATAPFVADQFHWELTGTNLSTPVLVVAVGISVSWFARTLNRPMLRAEILRFAAGTALTDILLSGLWLVSMLLLAGAPFSLKGIDAAVFDGSGFLLNQGDQIALFFLTAFTMLTTFLFAAFLAWLMTRKLPKKPT